MSGDTHQEHLRERARQQLTPARVGTDVGLSALLGFILYRTVKKSPVVKIAKATTELVHKPQALSIVKNVGKIGGTLRSLRSAAVAFVDFGWEVSHATVVGNSFAAEHSEPEVAQAGRGGRDAGYVAGAAIDPVPADGRTEAR